jgi:hypothetical protein
VGLLDSAGEFKNRFNHRDHRDLREILFSLFSVFSVAKKSSINLPIEFTNGLETWFNSFSYLCLPEKDQSNKSLAKFAKVRLALL